MLGEDLPENDSRYHILKNVLGKYYLTPSEEL